MKRYLLWDNDGVLVDTELWYFEATRRALANLNITLEQEIYLQRMSHGQSSWELAQAAGVDPTDIKAARHQRDAYYQQYLAQQDIEISGVEEVLKALALSHRMAIVTTSRSVDFNLIHSGRNINSYMEFTLTREDYVFSKPDPEPYITALKRFGADPESCLVIEDSQRGLQSAIAAGIDCAIVHNDFTANHNFSGARYMLGSIKEMLDILSA